MTRSSQEVGRCKGGRGSWNGVPFFLARRDFVKGFGSLFEGGGGDEPLAPVYTQFLNDFSWMHVVSTLANHQFLEMEKVIDSNVEDVFSYLHYMRCKGIAEKEQRSFEDKIKKH